MKRGIKTDLCGERARPSQSLIDQLGPDPIPNNMSLFLQAAQKSNRKWPFTIEGVYLTSVHSAHVCLILSDRNTGQLFDGINIGDVVIKP